MKILVDKLCAREAGESHEQVGGNPLREVQAILLAHLPPEESLKGKLPPQNIPQGAYSFRHLNRDVQVLLVVTPEDLRRYTSTYLETGNQVLSDRVTSHVVVVVDLLNQVGFEYIIIVVSYNAPITLRTRTSPISLFFGSRGHGTLVRGCQGILLLVYLHAREEA